MIKEFKNYINTKKLLEDFRLTKEDVLWITINQFKINKIEIIEEEFLKTLESEYDFKQLNLLLNKFDLELRDGLSDNHLNYTLVKKESDNKILFGILNEEEQCITKDNTFKIEEKEIKKIFYIEKKIQYLDFSDKTEKEPFSLKWIIKEFFNYKKLWKNILIWSLLIQLLSFALPLMTQTIVDKVIVNQAQSTLIALIIGVFLFNGFNLGLNWARQNMILFIGNKVDNTLAQQVMVKLFHLPLSFFQNRATGTIISRIHALESIRDFLSGSFITLVLDLPFVVIFLIIMASYSYLLSALTLCFVLIMMLLSWFLAPQIRNKALEQAKISGHNQAFMTEYVGRMETVKSLQLEEQLIKQYKQTFKAYLDKSKETKILAINYNTLMSWLEQTLNLLILGIGAYISMQGHDFTIGMLIAFQMFASRVTQPLLRISNMWQEFQQIQISTIRLKDIMDHEEENYSLIKNNNYSGEGEVRIENLSYKYEENLPLLYDNLNITIPAKSMLVITGPSGCGKSTLTKLLQGFYTNFSGNIKIDGIDTKQMSMVSLRNHFGVVPQETALFSGSILDNFKLVNPLIAIEEVIHLCKSVGIHEAISKLPEAYNTHLGENGSGLSGGQKQRITIARALAKKPKILIFDESVSSLDEISKKQVCETIKQLNGVITMIFITHIELENIGVYQKLTMTKNN